VGRLAGKCKRVSHLDQVPVIPKRKLKLALEDIANLLTDVDDLSVGFYPGFDNMDIGQFCRYKGLSTLSRIGQHKSSRGVVVK
jgi:hypothetical protein